MPPAATEVAMEAARTKNFISEWVVWVVRWFEIGQWINVLPLWGTGMTRVKLILMLPSFFSAHCQHLKNSERDPFLPSPREMRER